MKMIKPTLAAVAVSAALAGCATNTLMKDEQLHQAREAYRNAQNAPSVSQRASAELSAAKVHLDRAEALNTQGRAWHDIAHEGYLAEQNAHLAEKLADVRASQAAVAKANADRQQMMAEAQRRQAEFDRQRAEADAARAQAQQHAQAQQQAQATQMNEEIQKLQTQISEMKVQQTNRGWVLTLGNEVLFDSGSATLKPGAQRAIDNLARFMQDHKDRNIAIEGFADSQGSEESNQQLSERRADAVKQALASKGVDSSRLETRGYGEAYPIASNDNAAGRQLNRRVEIVIPNTGTQVGSRTQ